MPCPWPREKSRLAPGPIPLNQAPPCSPEHFLSSSLLTMKFIFIRTDSNSNDAKRRKERFVCVRL